MFYHCTNLEFVTFKYFEWEKFYFIDLGKLQYAICIVKVLYIVCRRGCNYTLVYLDENIL